MQMIVLPGGGYAAHAPHEAEPVASWLGEIGVQASVFRYPLNVRHPAPLDALRAEIARRRAEGPQRIGLMGFSAGGHLAGLAALAPGAAPGESVDFAVLGYAITSMETETYRPARLILLGGDASPRLRRSTCPLPSSGAGVNARRKLILNSMVMTSFSPVTVRAAPPAVWSPIVAMTPAWMNPCCWRKESRMFSSVSTVPSETLMSLMPSSPTKRAFSKMERTRASSMQAS